MSLQVLTHVRFDLLISCTIKINRYLSQHESRTIGDVHLVVEIRCVKENYLVAFTCTQQIKCSGKETDRVWHAWTT
jgi:hypothetical protein